MKDSINNIAWLADATVRELIHRFPLPIALLDRDGRALVLNDRFVQLFGASLVEAAAIREVLRTSSPDWTTVRVTSLRRGAILVNVRVLHVQENLMLIIDDVADPELLARLDELQAHTTELERVSATDSLTGIWNRTHFDRVIALELDRSIRFRHPVSLIYFDVDNFKQVNDTFGHQVGDAVLQELVGLTNSTIRLIDGFYRWGGEEFVVLAASTSYWKAATLAEKIRSKVEQHTFAGAGSVTVSLGVAEHMGSEKAQDWFRRVDDALYRAKRTGRNRVCVDPQGNSDVWAAEGGWSIVHLVWRDMYECGNPTIDREHRELFDLANALFDASFSSQAAPAAYMEALDKLMNHIAQHFADEEAVLEDHGYKKLESHRKAHAGLLARAYSLRASLAAGKGTLGDLVDFLANAVIAEHLFKADKDFFSLFQKPH